MVFRLCGNPECNSTSVEVHHDGSGVPGTQGEYWYWRQLKCLDPVIESW